MKYRAILVEPREHAYALEFWVNEEHKGTLEKDSYPEITESLCQWEARNDRAAHSKGDK